MNYPTRKFYIHPYYSDIIECACGVGCDNHKLIIYKYDESMEWNDNISHSHSFDLQRKPYRWLQRVSEAFKYIFKHDKFIKNLDGLYLNDYQVKNLYTIMEFYNEKEVELIEKGHEGFKFLWLYGELEIFVKIGTTEDNDYVVLYKEKGDDLIIYPVVEQCKFKDGRIGLAKDYILGHNIYPFTHNEVCMTDEDMRKFKYVLKKSLELMDKFKKENSK